MLRSFFEEFCCRYRPKDVVLSCELCATQFLKSVLIKIDVSCFSVVFIGCSRDDEKVSWWYRGTVDRWHNGLSRYSIWYGFEGRPHKVGAMYAGIPNWKYHLSIESGKTTRIIERLLLCVF